MALREMYSTHVGPAHLGHHQSSPFVELSQLRRLRQCEQVAAVCYRLGRNGIEFLLVQTRGSRRWTFPKGGVEPGLTHAQAAALEAFEEAGVHGRMEEAPFAQYVRLRRSGKKGSGIREEIVSAHLCEVLWQGPPEESSRNPKWFSPAQAKRRLREDRSPEFGAELARVADRAVAHIQRSQPTSFTGTDELQRVRFEAVVEGEDFRGRQAASLSRQVRRADGHATVAARFTKVLQFVSPPPLPQARALVAGDPDRALREPAIAEIEIASPSPTCSKAPRNRKTRR
jgi:8-oxo-dGTP pyrophosphatase MutT (NUDIX family)